MTTAHHGELAVDQETGVDERFGHQRVCWFLASAADGRVETARDGQLSAAR